MSTDGYVIRLAEPGDVAGLPSVERRAACLYEEWLAETGLTPAVLEQVGTLDEFEDARRQGHLWVAVSPDAGVIGFAQVVVWGRIVHLDELDVVPEHGRKGVGSRLLDTVCRWAGAAGYERLTLSTFRDVPWNRPFYERREFSVVDPRDLSQEHVELVAEEHARGLRTELRVIMEYRPKRADRRVRVAAADVAVAHAWIEAANQRDIEALTRLSDPDIDIVGPRGSVRGTAMLRDWLSRAGLTLESKRTFVRDGNVVVEQHGVWRSPETGEVVGEADVASRFRVDGAQVAAYERFDNLGAALSAAGLTGSDETAEEA